MKNVIKWSFSLGVTVTLLILLAILPVVGKAQRGGHGGGHGGGHYGRMVSHERHFRVPSGARVHYTWGGRNYTYSHHSPIVIHHTIYRPAVAIRTYPYLWHPYRPYFGWSIGWQPAGTFVAALAATAIVVGTITASEYSSPSNAEIFYDKGMYYQQDGRQYRVVSAPVGMEVPDIPEDATQCTVDDMVYYYFAGVFYRETNEGYRVVSAPLGAIVFNLPPGASELQQNSQSYYELDGVYYQPISYENSPAFQVVERP